MAQYVYEGPAPEEAPDGTGLVRPLDVREFSEPPGWGAWTEADVPDSPPAAPPVLPPAPGSTTTPATPAAPAAPAGTEG